MIPYFELKTIPLGPLTIQAWGLMVALGIFVGAWVGARMAKRRGLDPSAVWDAAVWIVIGAMVMARLFHVAFYDPARYLADPLSVVAIWEGGMSMFGGFAGALAAGIWFMRRRKLDIWQYADAMVYGLPVGIGIGRIGCFLIHDHPGTLTHFILGIKYPDGSVRHDLGLYESLNGLALFVVFLFLKKKNPSTGTFLTVFLLWYGFSRFILDFFRATDGAIVDARYAGLTPAQYVAVILFALGVIHIRRCRVRE